MNWPTIHSVEPISQKARRKASLDAKKAALKRDVEFLKAKQIANAPVPFKSKCSPDLEEFLLSDGFKSWYLEVVRKSPDFFIDTMLNCDEKYILRSSRDMWVIGRIKSLFDDNRWRCPHYRRYWKGNIANCSDPQLRRAIMLRLATPKWANLFEIAKIHRRRECLARETGIPHDVDHIIPLQGTMVCGLNTEANLQIITASENRSKSNKYYIY